MAEWNFGAHDLAVQDFLACHLVRHDEQNAVALARSDQGKTDTCVPCRRFDVIVTRSDVGRGHPDYYQDLAELIDQIA